MGYAIAITEENIRGVILSEAGPDFDINAALVWLEEFKEGWFVRDETSVLDCHYFTPETFAVMYIFTDNDQSVLMRKIEQI
jgi:hypothetical protein